MRLSIIAIGRARANAEASLVSEYLKRATQKGRSIGLGPVRLVETDAKRGSGRSGESAALLKHVPAGALCVCVDERGTAVSSEEFALQLASWRDIGHRESCFLIGGADGHDASLRDTSDYVVSLGPMIWPHMLVRVMLAEQLYRATTILAGTPYHRS